MFSRKYVQKGITLLNLLVSLSIVCVLGSFSIVEVWHYLPVYRLETSANQIAYHMVLARYRAIARGENWGLKFYEETNSYAVTRFVEGKPVESFDQLGPFPLGKGIRYGGRKRSKARPGPTTFFRDQVIFSPMGFTRGISGSVYIVNECYLEGVKTRQNLRHRRRVVVRCRGGFISVQKTW